MQSFFSFLASDSIWVYFIIFFGKMVEVAATTLRYVLIGRGERVLGALVAFAEMTLWVFVTGTVLSGFQSNPIKAVVFIVAFSLGTFLGSWLDEKIAVGLSEIQVILPDRESAKSLATTLRNRGFGVTSMDVQGRDDSNRYMLMLTIKRKSMKEALAIIETSSEKPHITVTDVKVQRGGFIRPAPGLFSQFKK